MVSRDEGASSMFQQLCTISTLSTGRFPHLALSRIGAGAHCRQVIGTAVPASPNAGNGKRARRVTKGPISCRQAVGALLRKQSGSQPVRGAGRDDLPLCATRLKPSFGTGTSKAGRKDDHPKKGRGMSGGFDFGQAGSVERPAGFRAAQSGNRSGSSHEGAVRREATPELVSQDRKRIVHEPSGLS